MSLTAAAGCYLPPRWDPTRPASGALFDTWGGKVEDRELATLARRVGDIVRGIVEFVTYRRQETDAPVHVFVEDYAYGKSGKSGIVLAELGGAVKHELFRRWGLVVVPVHQGRSRSFLLGGLPKGKGTQAPAVVAAVQRLGFHFGASDPGDAFVVANFGRAELGLPGVTFAG